MISRELAAVLVFLGSAVAANSVVGSFGQKALPLTALVLIPIDLCVRDALHERWSGVMLWPRMIALVLAGSALSLATAAQSVCVASCVAFCCSGLADAGAYSAMHGFSRASKMNVSNMASASIDSLVFPLVAFGYADLRISATQAAMKVLGGAVFTAFMVRWIAK